jgi:hypothetical protein
VLQGNDQWGNGKILLLPTVIVNKHQYRGRLDVPSILRALCAGFSETTEPEVSQSAAQCLLLDALHSRYTECQGAICVKPTRQRHWSKLYV